MNALDKIYLLKVELEERWPGITEASELEPQEEECYIRKNALIEWAKEMKRICRGAKPIEKAYQTMIDKIESL